MRSKQIPLIKNDGREQSRNVTRRFMMLMNEIIMFNKLSGGEVKTAKAFAASIRSHYQNFSNYTSVEKERNVTLEMCCELCRVHGVNANWLLLGKGEKYNQQDNHSRLNKLEERMDAVEAKVGIKKK